MPRQALSTGPVLLRPLEDVSDTYVRWLNDHEVTRYMTTGRTPVSREDVLRYLERFRMTDDVIFAIVDRASARHIGNVTLNNVNRVDGIAATGIMIGEKQFWGKGYATAAWAIAIDHGFGGLGLRKLFAGACAPNVASIRALKRLGFQLEGTHRREFYVDGDYVDVLRFGLFPEEFRRPA